MANEHDDVAARLEVGRTERVRRRNISGWLTYAAVLLFMLTVGLDEPWLRGVRWFGFVGLIAASWIVECWHDSAAVDRLARVTMIGFAVVCVTTVGLGVGYGFADREIPPGVAIDTTSNLSMLVVIAHRLREGSGRRDG